MKWATLFCLIGLLSVGLIPFTACETGISAEQREHYLALAEEYDNKASEAQGLSDEYWANHIQCSQDAEYWKDEAESMANLVQRWLDLSQDWLALAEDLPSSVSKGVYTQQEAESLLEEYSQEIDNCFTQAYHCQDLADAYNENCNVSNALALDWQHKSEQQAELAEEYRQQANQYRVLAAQ